MYDVEYREHVYLFEHLDRMLLPRTVDSAIQGALECMCKQTVSRQCITSMMKKKKLFQMKKKYSTISIILNKGNEDNLT